MGHKNFKDYIFEDFIKDAYFRKWVYTTDEKANHFWDTFVRENPSKAVDIEKAKLFLEGIHEYYDSNKLSEAQIEEKYSEFISKHSSAGSPKIRVLKRNRKKVFNYAAAASIVILIAFSLFYTNSGTNYYTTAYGEYKKIELPDGTQVTLGANSKLRLAKKWDNTVDRKVWLDGEAYFNVKHIETNQAKFIVITDDVNVEVLGTAFNVDNRKEDTKVILDKGKIKLDIKGNLNKQLLMAPGEKITYKAKSRKLPEKQKANKDETSWRDGVMTYTNTPLHVVLSKMEDVYGIQLKLKDNALRDKEVTVGISITDQQVAVTTIERIIGTEFIK
ncbi:FecR family protein [Spongiimicrobium sp. 3-5]|uniref:FecR family protein n=1 Tax=Spongiimicrobium sp. 3-5 TaxID=3332596 RepID=UPI003981384A